MNLQEQLAAAKAHVERLGREIAAAGCRKAGCDMRHVGGRNAGCDLGKDCSCSVPVYECTRCRDSDYGDNPEAKEIRLKCAERA